MEVTLDALDGTRLATLIGNREDSPHLLVSGLTDWYSVPAPNQQGTTFALRHGQTRGGQWRPGRAFSLSGYALGHPRGRATLHELRDKLAGVVGSGDLVRVTVTDDDYSTSRDATLDALEVSDDNGLPRIPWALDCIAPDPRRYSPETTHLAGKVIYNSGTAPTSPRIEIRGPIPSTGVTVTESGGRQMKWVGTVASGSWLVLDESNGYALAAGYASAGLRKFQWPSIPPGESRSYTATAGTLQVVARSAWW